MSNAAPIPLEGRRVLITGAARGIGAETARRLHAAGARVALAGLEPELLAAASPASARTRRGSSATSATATRSSARRRARSSDSGGWTW